MFKWVAGMGVVISRSDHIRQAPSHLSCSDMERAQNASPTESAPLWSTWVPEPECLDLGSAYNPGLASDSSQQSNLEPKQCRQGKHTCREWGKPSVAETLQAHASVICLQRSSLPTARLNKWALKNVYRCPLCVRVEIRQWRGQQTEEAKINRGNCFGSDRCNRLKPCS